MPRVDKLLEISKDLIAPNSGDLLQNIKSRKIHRISVKDNRLTFHFAGSDSMKSLEFESYEEAKDIGEMISKRLSVKLEVY